ncbi:MULTISPECIES: VOC family protein [Actinoalloteichus]|uniref:VOC family protein n=1 Tax=Actinoalloteichus TaxID=65496 RepID=UPI0009512CA3|nr:MULTISPECIES: VOC family protein [Actinoalloteichus]
MIRLHDIVVDCARPAALARFWAAALDDYEVAPYDEEELARLRAEGIDDPEDDPLVLVEPRADGGPRLFFQLVPEPKIAKNRLHLDLRCDDLSAGADRLIKLGARVLSRTDDWIVLGDPEDNEFCLGAETDAEAVSSPS